MRRYRPALSVASFVLVALVLPIGTVALWANHTVYDSAAFSTRTVELLDAPSARAELANRITRQLAESGYRPAVAFRPAFQFAVEVAVDTQAFRSIFRGAVQRFHAALLANRGIGDGLDLSDALSIITSTVQLPSDARSTGGNEALGSTLENLTRRAAALQLWNWDDVSSAVAVGAIALAFALGAVGIAVALDRRRAIARLGLAVMASGVIVLTLRALTVLAARRLIRDHTVADALGDGLWRVTDDVEVIGLWLLGYGAVVAAAVSLRPLTPRAVAGHTSAWLERRRATPRGWLVIGLGLIVAGLLVTSSSPLAFVQLVVYVGGLWLIYLGVHELVAHISALQAAAGDDAVVHGERRRLLLAGGAVGLVLALLTTGFVVATRRAEARAEEAGARRCNGDDDLCGARLDQVSFPGTHNSMSATLYPGWLFGEQIPTIAAQLDAGMRAFLFDTHYGEATNVQVPGSDTPLVVTDRAAELSAPPGSESDIDPAIEQRALALSQRAPRSSDAQRQIFLCHNYCELGAVRFSSVLGETRAFLDSHPDEVVIFVIQDATTVADTVAAIEQAGLGDRVATLRKGQPLPTLGELIGSDERLVVFAEQGGEGGPAWYMKAYDWFQETGFTFPAVDAFDCRPNRGSPANPLFLLNHWVGRSPPDPSVAGQANDSAVLERRIQTCLTERGLLPNIIAVDFGSRGDLLAMTKAVSSELRGRDPQGAAPGPGGGGVTTATPTSTPPTSSTTATPTSTPPTSTPPTGGGSDLPDVPDQTSITTLTGGDPAAFCAVEAESITALSTFAVAALSEAPLEAGLADLAFGPLLVRTLDRSLGAAPVELASRARPLHERARAAVAALTVLGAPLALIDRLGDLGETALADVALDPLALELRLLDELRSAVGETRLIGAGRAFIAAQGDVTGQLDLGEVPADVARRAGYDCLAAS